MPPKEVKQEIRIALFGPSASGKTTLLASYYGNQQANSFEEEHGYRLAAEDTSDGNSLLAHYYRMENGQFPLGTSEFHEYKFGVKVHGMHEEGLRVVWYDYPGGWWENTPKDESEKEMRRAAFRKLITSHVGILLVDGSRYQTDGIKYVKHLFSMFRNEIRRISDEYAQNGSPVAEGFPNQWIIAISKADVLSSEHTIQNICKQIVMQAEDEMKGVAKTMGSNSFGSQYLLLSSVRGEGVNVTDAHVYVGLQLIAPVALCSVLYELAHKAKRDNGGAGFFHAILVRLAGLADLIDKLDDFLPPKFQVLTKILQALEIKDGLDKGAVHYREKMNAAAKKGKAVEAVANAMKSELSAPAAEKAYYKNQ